MRNTWRHYLRRFAVTSVICGSTAWSSAMCYAVQLAYDDADDPVYADGWQEGDDGGTGSFGPWNFDGSSYNFSYTAPETNVHRLDDGEQDGGVTSNPFNDIGRAWTMYNKSVPGGAGNKDITRAGRSIDPLQVGQTLRVVIDNPYSRGFFRGYSFKLNTGGANACYNGDNCTTPAFDPESITLKYKTERWDYFNYGEWYDTTGVFTPSLFDRDSVAEVGTNFGAQIDFTLETATTYELTMTALRDPVNGPPVSITQTGNLDNPDVTTPIDWIEFQFWNTQSSLAPDAMTPATNTDLYIRSLEIFDTAPPGLPGDYNEDGTVDAADYVVWRRQDGSQAGYNTWRANFGNSSPGGGSAGAVPEPGTIACLLGMLAGWFSWWRRNQETS